MEPSASSPVDNTNTTTPKLGNVNAKRVMDTMAKYVRNVMKVSF